MNENVKNALDNFKKQDYKSAVLDFEKALEEDKENPHLLNNIGLCYAKLALDEKAEHYYLEALKIDNTMVQTYVNLADVYYKEKRIPESINLLESGVTLMPENIVLKHYLARIYIEDIRYELAMEQLSEILDLSPDNKDALWDLGTVYFELGDNDSAIGTYEQLLEQVTDNPVIYYQTGLAYESNDNLDKAISNYLKAISLNEKFHPAYKKLGMLFLARGEKEDSIEYFNDYLNFDLPEEEKQSINDLIARISK